MNYYNYNKRKNKKNKSIIMILSLVVVFCIFIFFVFDAKSKDDNGIIKNINVSNKLNKPIFLKIDKINDYIESNIINSVSEGEFIKTNHGGIVLNFFDGSYIIMDSDTEIEILETRKIKNNQSKIIIDLKQGNIWTFVSRNINQSSVFAIKNKDWIIKTNAPIDTTFAIDKNGVYAIAGNIKVQHNNEEIDLEMGQQIIFENNLEKTILSTVFQESEWYIKNVKENNEKDNMANKDNSLDNVEKNIEKITINNPIFKDNILETSDNDFYIKGVVPNNTQRIIINNYSLQKYKPNDSSFQYRVSEKFNNLKEGENTYKITAVSDNDIHELDIKIIYKKNSNNNEGETKNLSSNDIKLISPQEGSIIEDESFIIKGNVPNNTYFVFVNDYLLKKFKNGDEYWQYKISNDFNNRKLGENELEVVFKDNEEKIITKKIFKFTIINATSEPTI